MLRLDPADGVRLVQASSFEARFTGDEANVAASLTQFGISSQVVGTVPDDALGDAALAFLRRFGVDTTAVLRRPGRLGLLYVEPGGGGRPGPGIYDRAGGGFALTRGGASRPARRRGGGGGRPRRRRRPGQGPDRGPSGRDHRQPGPELPVAALD